MSPTNNFYERVLATTLEKHCYQEMAFAVFEHEQGNGGCLVPRPDEVSDTKGFLVYLNVNGRIDDAVKKVEASGGKILEEIHSIGEHGVRAIVVDSEGNRFALHSSSEK